MALVRGATIRGAEESLDDLQWLRPWTAKADTDLDFWHSPWRNAGNGGSELDISEEVLRIVQVELGGTPERLWECRRKLFILINRIQKYGPFGKLVSVGCIATPTPKLSDIKKKIVSALDNYSRTKGKDENGNVVCRLRDPKVAGISWVTLLDDYHRDESVIINDVEWEPEELRSGIYGLQVWVTHTISDGSRWCRRTDATICAFKFRWRQWNVQGQAWKKRIYESGLQSLALSFSNSLVGQTVREMLEEHSHSLLSHASGDLASWKTSDEAYKTELKEWKQNRSKQSSVTSVDTDRTDGSRRRLWGRRKSRKVKTNPKPKAPPLPKRKGTSIVQATKAASERISIFGSSDSSGVWDPSDKITLASLLSGTSGLDFTVRTGISDSSMPGGSGG